MGRRKREKKPQQPKPRPVRSITQIPVESAWKRSHKKLYSILGFLAIMVALWQGYPWLSLQESGLLDASNAYSQLFNVVNDGYVPVTNLSANCNFATVINGNRFTDGNVDFGQFADYLAHDGMATVPCFRTVSGASPAAGSKLKITIGYAFYHLNLKLLRRSQSFRFESVIGTDHIQHWIRLQ